MSNLFVLPRAEVQDSSGGVLAGAKLEFFTTGTSTNLDTYSDDALTTANANPVVADSAGRFGAIFLRDEDYKVTLSDSDDVQTWSADPVRGGLDNFADDTIKSTLDTTGSANAYALTVNRVITAYANGDMFVAKANFENTSTATLNVTGGQSGASALGAKTIKKHHDQNLASGDIEVGQWCAWKYDGTNFQLLSPLGTAFTVSTTVEDSGAKGDGSTDDSTAFSTALATGKTVELDGSKTYVLKDITIGGLERLIGNGARIVPAAGAKYLFRLTGFRPELHSIEISDNSDVVVVSTTLSGAEAAAQTVLSVTSTTGLEVGMIVLIEMDSARWHVSLIDTVGGSTITIARALEGNAASGKAVVASWGLINIRDATRWVVDHLFGINVSFGILNDSDPNASLDSNVRGMFNNVNLQDIKYLGILHGRNVGDNRYNNIYLRGGKNETDSYTGDGSDTTFSMSSNVWRKTDLTVKLDGVTQTITTDYTFNSEIEIAFVSAPGNGVAIDLIHFKDGKSGFCMDATGWDAIRGGDHINLIEVLDFVRGVELHTKELTTFDQLVVDTISREALFIDDSCEEIRFGMANFTYAHQPILIDGSSTPIVIGGPVFTTLAPTADLVGAAVATETINVASGSRLKLNGAAWHEASNFSWAAAGDFMLSGADHMYSADPATVASGVTTYFGPNGHNTSSAQEQFMVPRRMRILKMVVAVDGVAGASESFTYTVRVNGSDQSMTGSISGASALTVTDIDVVILSERDRVDIKLVTSASATARRHRIVLTGI